MFSKTTEYAIRVIIFLAVKSSNRKTIGVSEIALELEFPEAFLGKVLQTLVKKDLIISIKGPGGGFYLHNNTFQLYIIDIVDKLESLSFLDKCGLGMHSCNKENPCPIHDDYKNVSENIRKALSSKTIKEIAQNIELGNSNFSFSF